MKWNKPIPKVWKVIHIDCDHGSTHNVESSHGGGYLICEDCYRKNKNDVDVNNHFVNLFYIGEYNSPSWGGCSTKSCPIHIRDPRFYWNLKFRCWSIKKEYYGGPYMELSY